MSDFKNRYWPDHEINAKKQAFNSFIEKAERLLFDIQKELITISDYDLSLFMYPFEETAQKIIDRIKSEHFEPSQILSLNHYYFPTTITLLKNYQIFQHVSPDEINKILNGLSQMKHALDQFLLLLITPKVIDLEAELAVLKTKMVLDGLDEPEPS